MAARTRRGTSEAGWDENVRVRIKTSMLVNRLSDHVAGKVDLKPTQVSAALGLLRKTVPDLSATEISGTVNFRRANEVTDDELANIAAGSSEGTAEAPVNPSKLN